MSRVDGWADLDRAIDYARQTDPKVLVEAAVLGREIELEEIDTAAFKGTFKTMPQRSELPSTINESLVVELYSK